MATGPTIRKRQLGAALRQLREARGYTRQEAATVLGCAQSKVGHMEAGRNPPRKPDLQVLLEYYGASGELDRLEALRRESGGRGWWSTYKLPPWLNSYVALEDEAVRMYSFAGEAIPGLLQTADYSRATHEAVSYQARPGDIDQRVEARTRRASRLTTEPLLEMHAVISEAAIRRALGLGASGVEQLAHLVAMSERANVHVQIVPEAMGLHASLSGSFVLLDFGGEAIAPPAAYQEFAAGGQVVDDPVIVGDLTAAWNRLHDTALGEAPSADWMRDVLREHGDKG